MGPQRKPYAFRTPSGSRPIDGHSVQSYSRGSDPGTTQRSGQRRMEDRLGEVAGGRADLDRAVRGQLVVEVCLERIEVGRQHPIGHAERPRDRLRLLVEPCRLVARDGPGPGVVHGDRRIDQGRVDPQRQGGVPCRVATSRDPAVERVQAADLAARARCRAIDDAQVAAQRPIQPAPWIGPEVGVLGDAGGDRWVGELQEQRPRAGTEEQHRLAIHPPRLGVGAEHPGVAVARIHGRTIDRHRGRHRLGTLGLWIRP